mgnify:FL=1|jgi:hypothetical protein|tara:strand:+ start:77 stop:427 length:351 start_codon:yes stop_codon:yes gene_type:complete
MSLKFDYTKCITEDWGDTDRISATNFCWSLTAVDIGEVTEKTKDELYFRFRFLEKIGKNVFTKPIDPRQLGGLLDKLTGYTTNIKTCKRFQFIRRHVKNLEQEIQHDNGSLGDVIQ